MKKIIALLSLVAIALTGAGSFATVSAETLPSAHISSFNLELEGDVHVYFRAYYEGIDKNSDDY